VHHRDPQVERGVVDEIPGGVTVRPVDHDVVPTEQLEGVGGGEANRMGADLDLGVEVAQGASGRFHLGLAHPVGVVEDLALQVGDLDPVAVDQGDGADPGGGEVEGGGGPEAAGSDDGDLGGEQAAESGAAAIAYPAEAQPRIPPARDETRV